MRLKRLATVGNGTHQQHDATRRGIDGESVLSPFGSLLIPRDHLRRRGGLSRTVDLCQQNGPNGETLRPPLPICFRPLLWGTRDRKQRYDPLVRGFIPEIGALSAFLEGTRANPCSFGNRLVYGGSRRTHCRRVDGGEPRQGIHSIRERRCPSRRRRMHPAMFDGNQDRIRRRRWQARC
jgi:hypothetical protein